MGDFTKWQSFMDLFYAAVHSFTQISNVEKCNYLRSYFEGDDPRFISALPLTSKNYEKGNQNF